MSLNNLLVLLRKLKTGSTFDEVKEEIQEIIANIKLNELYFAEHQMIEAGIPTEQIKSLLSPIKTNNKIDILKNKLNPGHVLHTFICEHEQQFALLDQLRNVNLQIQDLSDYNEAKDKLEHLLIIMQKLKESELHELREEKVLFPELDSRGIFGQPYIMQLDHNVIDDYREELESLASSASQRDFDQLKNRINILVKFLVLKLSAHISQENNVIYPLAFKVIDDEAVWENMKRDCDRIGYCSYSKIL